jgi:hypothetical protein
MLNEIYWQGIPDSGTVTIADCEPCRIAFYQIKVKPAGSVWGGVSYNVFVGETTDGERLSDSDCRRIMDLPVVEFTATGESYGIRDGNKSKPSNPLDELICVDEYIRRAVADTDDARSEEIAASCECSNGAGCCRKAEGYCKSGIEKT